MYEVFEFVLIGIALGFASGISPGPLLAMTISETLKYGSKEGFKVALSPLITDILIISSVMLILINLEKQDFILGFISLFGAMYLIYLGISSFKIKNISHDFSNQKNNSFMKGILANLLSPHPYLFWITIGGPIIFRTLKTDILITILFIASFYTFLVGSKIMIALIVGRYRSLLKNKYYMYIIHGLGAVYFVFALFFIMQAIELFGFYI